MASSETGCGSEQDAILEMLLLERLKHVGPSGHPSPLSRFHLHWTSRGAAQVRVARTADLVRGWHAEPG